MKEEKYISSAVPTEISATSRVAIKIRDNFYTVEYTEKRTVLLSEQTDMKKERQLLFDDVNAVVDAQSEDILRTFQKK